MHYLSHVHLTAAAQSSSDDFSTAAQLSSGDYLSTAAQLLSFDCLRGCQLLTPTVGGMKNQLVACQDDSTDQLMAGARCGTAQQPPTGLGDARIGGDDN